MANTNDIFIKMNIDTSSFNGSVKGMQDEIKKLKTLLGNNLLSKEDQQAILSRITELKDNISDINISSKHLDSFEVVNKGVTALSGGLAAASGAMKLMGIENEKLNKAMEVAQVVMAASISLQQIKDLSLLKNIALTAAQSVATGVATAAQLAWNVAMTANPIGAIIVAITALIAGIVLLTKWLSKSTDETENNAKANAKANVERLTQLRDRLDAEGATAEEIYKVEKELLENELKLLDGKSDEYEKKYNELLKLNREYAEDKKAQDIKNLQDFGEYELMRLELQGATDKEMLDQKIKNIEAEQKLYGKGTPKWMELQVQKKRLLEEFAEQEKQTAKEAADAAADALEDKKQQAEEEKQLLEEKNRAIEQSILDDLDANVLRLQNEGATEEEILDAKIRRIEAEQSLYEDQPLKWEKLQAEKLRLTKEYNDKEITEAEAKFKELDEKNTQAILDDLDANVLKLQNEGATEEEILDAKIRRIEAEQSLYEDDKLKWEELEQEKLRLQKEYNNDELQEEKRKKDEKVALVQATFASITKIMGALAQFYDAKMEEEIEAAGDNEAKKEKIRKEYGERKKRMAIIQAIIDTASMILSAANTMPFFPMGMIMAVTAAALGALQIATISKQQFARGGVLIGPSHADGGIMTPYGELEGDEGVINKVSMSIPSVRNLASAANVAGGGSDFSVGDGSVKLSNDSISQIISGINNKKVYVVESDITETQKKVSVIENTATI